VSACFITGTGTDVGKTFLAAGLIREFRRRGERIAALKPVVSGFDPARAAASDPGILLAALGRTATDAEIARIAPWRFRAPLAPDMAAQRENRRVDFAALVEFCRSAIAASEGMLLIEGVGGIMVPLDERRTVLDWIMALRLPVIVVAGSYLGTISHSLTALAVLRQHDLEIAALVISETAGSTVALDDTVAAIARFAGGIAVLGLPLLASGEDHALFARLADILLQRQVRIARTL